MIIHTDTNQHRYYFETHEHQLNPIFIHYSNDFWKTRHTVKLRQPTVDLFGSIIFKTGSVVYFFEEKLSNGESHFSHPYGSFDIFSRSLGWWLFYQATEEQHYKLNLQINSEWGCNLKFRSSVDGTTFSKMKSIGFRCCRTPNHTYMRRDQVILEEYGNNFIAIYFDKEKIILRTSPYDELPEMKQPSQMMEIDIRYHENMLTVLDKSFTNGMAWFRDNKGLNYKTLHRTEDGIVGRVVGNNLSVVVASDERVCVQNIEHTGAKSVEPTDVLVCTRLNKVTITLENEKIIRPVKQLVINENLKIYQFSLHQFDDCEEFFWTNEYQEYRYPNNINKMIVLSNECDLLKNNVLLM